jgi:transposase
MVEQSAAPLAAVESQFAIDSTGFSTSVYRRWYDHKYGREMKEHAWIKAHVMTGTLTNVVTAIRVTEGSAADSPELSGLVRATSRGFAVREVSADKAYLTHANLAAVEAVGAAPFVPFKSNSTGSGSAAWRRMWGLFMYKQPEFLAHYHRRSNVESTFSMMKAEVRRIGALQALHRTGQRGAVQGALPQPVCARALDA